MNTADRIDAILQPLSDRGYHNPGIVRATCPKCEQVARARTQLLAIVDEAILDARIADLEMWVTDIALHYEHVPKVQHFKEGLAATRKNLQAKRAKLPVNREVVAMSKPLYIRIMKHVDPPGHFGTILTVRVTNDPVRPSYDRTTTISDFNNVAGRSQLLVSLLKMITDAQGQPEALSNQKKPRSAASDDATKSGLINNEGGEG